MTISLTPEQRTWINARVARGDFTSAEEAARQLVDERIAERTLEEPGRSRMGQATPRRGTG
jgi:antitoxin ParD1/3/4